MVEITGRTTRTNFSDGRVQSTWRIPSLGKRFARQQAIANEKVKGRTNISVESVQQVELGSLPGQKIYLVDTVADR